MQHAEVVNGDDGGKTSADRAERRRQVEEVGTDLPSRALDTYLVPPEVAYQGSGHGPDCPRGRGRYREPAADADEALAEHGEQGRLQAPDIASRARKVERAPCRIERDTPVAQDGSFKSARVTSDPSSQKKTQVSRIELKGTAVMPFSRMPAATAATTTA